MTRPAVSRTRQWTPALATVARYLLLITVWGAPAHPVPFVTKRVSLHNPITIDFSGWRPLRETGLERRHPTSPDDARDDAKDDARPLDDHFLTVPVAVETDAEHVLSESDLNAIRERVIANWRERPNKEESFAHLRPLVPHLLPKPEVEREVRPETGPSEGQEALEARDSEFTFVKMEPSGGQGGAGPAPANSSDLFHAYLAPREHVPPPGYVRMSRREFERVFRNAEILFVK